MGIIGSYRGCDLCRKWKKKCDTTHPEQPCSRCRARNIPCVGAGQQRLKFKNQSLTTCCRAQPQESLAQLQWPIYNSNDRISSTLVSFLDSTHPGYSFMAFRPSLISQLPKRTGYSKVLDASLAVFTSVITTQQFEEPNHASLKLYISGLKELQKSLANPIARHDSSTLTAAYILSECNVWMAQNSYLHRGHGEGLAYLIGVLLSQKPRDAFFHHTCFAIAAYLVVESVFNANIQLHPWVHVLYNVSEHPPRPDRPLRYPPGSFLRMVVMVPDLMRRPRENKEQIRWAYNFVLDLRLRGHTAATANKETPSWDTREAVQLNEVEGMCIAIGITLNAFLRAFDPSNIRLEDEKLMICTDAVDLGERAKQERPMSAHHVPQAILAAWCVTEEVTTKEKLWQLIEDYKATYAMARMVQHVAYWKEAPARLREIPWLRFCYAEEDDQNSNIINTKGEAEVIHTRLDEFCCIL